MTKFTLEIYRPVGRDGGVACQHREVFDLGTERDAAMVLVATRERLPRGWLAGMTFSRNGTRTNVRTRDERDPETDGAQPMRASAVKRGRDPRFPYIPVVVRENGTHNTNTRKAFTTRAEAVAFAQDWIDHARRVLAIAAARRAARHAGTDA